MKLANAIEGGVTGAGVLSLLQDAVQNHKSSSKPLLHQAGLLKKLKKNNGKPGMKSAKLYIQLASELVSNAAMFGLGNLGKKRNAILRGTIVGAAAGIGSVLLQHKKDSGKVQLDGDENGFLKAVPVDAETRKKIVTVGLYTAGGLLAGVAVKKLNGKKVKKTLKRLGKKFKW